MPLELAGVWATMLRPFLSFLSLFTNFLGGDSQELEGTPSLSEGTGEGCGPGPYD